MMIVNEALLADLKQEADEIWARHKEAEKIAEKTDEAILAKELLSHWHAANRRFEAVKLLVEHEKSQASREASNV